MIFNVNIAMTWLLFLALFPISFFWLRRAWRIVVRRDFSEVALKRGMPPPNPEKYAPYAVALNLIAAGILLWVIFGVLVTALPYDSWTAIAGSTIWMKIVFDFILSRQAHIQLGRKVKDKRDKQT